jgi:hypothetical protein
MGGVTEDPTARAKFREFVVREDGLAFLITIIGLSLFSLLSLYLLLSATTEVRVSDNYESQIQARYAAQAGLNHTRAILRGLRFDDLLRGPDGAYTNTTSYLAYARTFAFRNPLAWDTARSISIFTPASDLPGIADDGLVNTGRYASTHGTQLIPLVGIAQTAPNPYGSGTVTTSRYFVRVSDNNGEPAEIAGDPFNNPFTDGDGTIIVRSMGISQTVREMAGSAVRRNSVAVFESRFRQRTTFDLDAPLVVQGDAVLPSAASMFDGNSFQIEGGAGNVGIATIDVNSGNAIAPSQQIKAQVAANQFDNIAGAGLSPSIADITAGIAADHDKALLLNKEYLWSLANTVIPMIADSVYSGNQDWAGGSAPDLGSYDPALPSNAPSQRPRVTCVNGDLSVSGNMEGGGLLVVTGRFTANGRFTFNGLILVVGEGDMDAGELNRGVTGGIYISSISQSGGTLNWGTPRLTMSGNSNITINSEAIRMALRLIPPAQLDFREVTSNMDP